MIDCCKDCGSTTRALTKPGPRCVTCWRAETKRRKAVNHEKRVMDIYGLAPGDYDKLCQVQEGRCAVCRIAKCVGVSGKHLAVHHDHATGRALALLCVFCNNELEKRGLLSIEGAQRIIDLINHPPAELAGIVSIHLEKR